ncbi:hypothetical protein FH968_19730 [Buttiauxella sp. B2]|uniref:hypothetical protein n=1 Tax=Buttiauxella sp. B2 TaxID=2587812 RepID=UPI001122E0D9|nr:hypothetical protein [Buttiauxella sp. B2]TNV16075.1 hypothetical protein FH968_19730 [Buttiauxella sp. B2]
MKNIKSILPIIYICSSAATFSAISSTPDITTTVVNPQSIGVFGADYGVFKSIDTDALIKSVKLLEKDGFNTAVVTNTLDLNSYKGSVIIFKSSANGKPLSSEKALAAFKKNMQVEKLSAQDAILIKNTPLSLNEGGTVINQSYNIIYAGKSETASQYFQVPQGGLALTIVKMDDGKLLVITTNP